MSTWIFVTRLRTRVCTKLEVYGSAGLSWKTVCAGKLSTVVPLAVVVVTVRSNVVEPAGTLHPWTAMKYVLSSGFARTTCSTGVDLVDEPTLVSGWVSTRHSGSSRYA